MSAVRIVRIKFNNFKAFKDYSVSLDRINVLVGPNNSGKSTLLSAFRLLDMALRKARTRPPERLSDPTGRSESGYRIAINEAAISLENVATDYNDRDSTIIFELSNGGKLRLIFSVGDQDYCMFWELESEYIRSAAGFKKHFAIDLQVVPVLGPLEHEETIVTKDTVSRSLNTHRASRHFRNYWTYFPEEWESFRSRVEKTWPGMVIKPPERTDPMSQVLTMFCAEERIDREVYWSGFGFQIWCQLLTHLSRARAEATVVIDEPEIYLHPDVQRQLLSILRSLDCDVVLATHSVEIIGEADPSELLLVDKKRNSAQRLKDIEGMQKAVECVGSAQNITLTQLARTKRMLFLEGPTDFRLIKKFAQKLGFEELAAGKGVTVFDSGGFGSRNRVMSLAWAMRSTLGREFSMMAVYDRDYLSDEEVHKIEEEFESTLQAYHIHRRKELENYLLIPSVVERAVNKALREKARRAGKTIDGGPNVSLILEGVTRDIKHDVVSQYAVKRSDFLSRSGIDKSTLTSEVLRNLDSIWESLDTRMCIVPGKEVLKQLRGQLEAEYSITLSDSRLIDAFHAEEVPTDLRELIEKLDKFRSGV